MQKFNINKRTPTCDSWYAAATNHGKPTPIKTFTAILPEICIRAPSAYFSDLVTKREAKVSGKDVPKATRVIAEILE